MRLFSVCLIVLVSSSFLSLDAAARKPKHKSGKQSEMQGATEALKDAKEKWAQQQPNVVVGVEGTPYVLGSHLWRGRGDEDYKPFHRWELSVHAGDADRNNLRVRIIPLDARLNEQTVVQPHLYTVPPLAAGTSCHVSYKLNCTKVTGYKVILSWDDGEALYESDNEFDLPYVRNSAGDKVARLVVSEPDFEYSKRHKKAKVTFYLANRGAVDAEEVVCTVHFMDEKGKALRTHEYKPDKKGIIEAGYGKQQTFIVKKVKPFYTIRITTAKKESLVVGGTEEDLVPGELNIIQAAVTGDKESPHFTATVVNLTGTLLNTVTVALELTDAEGTVMKSYTLKTSDPLPDGERVVLRQDIGKVPFIGFAYGYSYE